MSALEGYSGGYPYLRIARHYGVDYGDVLKFSEELENSYRSLTSADHWDLRVDILVANEHFKRLRAGRIDASVSYDVIRALA